MMPMKYERELKNELEEGQNSQNMRNEAKWKMGFTPIESLLNITCLNRAETNPKVD